MDNAARPGYSELDGAEIGDWTDSAGTGARTDGTRTGAETMNDDGPEGAECEIDIVTR